MSHHARVGPPDDGQHAAGPTDNQVRRALTRCDLPGNARGVLHALLTIADYRTLTTGAEHTPSLATLAVMSGYSEATVKRELNRLETTGWVIRLRPAAADARARKVRTRYRITQSPDGWGVGLTQSPEQGSDRATGWAHSEPHVLAGPSSPSSSSGEPLDESEPGTGQTGHGHAPAVEVDPHGDDVQALTAAGGIPASWETDIRAALDRGCTPGQIGDAYRAPITGTVSSPAAVRRARIRDLAPEPARPAAPTVAVPPNVRSMCRQHGLPGPCPVCADLEATRAADVVDEVQVPAAGDGLEADAEPVTGTGLETDGSGTADEHPTPSGHPAGVLSAATLDTLTAVRGRLPRKQGPRRRRR
ncbi:helix-turn-helix domain-containing protein [Parafrankia sp. FMc2]|uniref:helix-turn-helix domain-containing protein n=1 Tax=Parafrankia sp. FMc2 TaxID=3233196 RepID=UPI0034D749B6